MEQAGDKTVRNWAMGCHLAATIGSVISPSMAHLWLPLIVWLMKKNDDPFIDAQGREAVNFQITMTILAAIGLATLIFGIGWLILIVLYPLNIIMTVIAAIKASDGVAYRYPFCIRLV